MGGVAVVALGFVVGSIEALAELRPDAIAP
jgi:hypothetical protein